MMKSHKLARDLLKMPNMKVTASVDMSTCDEDAANRVFTHDLTESQNDSWMGVITLIFINGEEDYAKIGRQALEDSLKDEIQHLKNIIKDIENGEGEQ